MRRTRAPSLLQTLAQACLQRDFVHLARDFRDCAGRRKGEAVARQLRDDARRRLDDHIDRRRRDDRLEVRIDRRQRHRHAAEDCLLRPVDHLDVDRHARARRINQLHPFGDDQFAKELRRLRDFGQVDRLSLDRRPLLGQRLQPMRRPGHKHRGGRGDRVAAHFILARQFAGRRDHDLHLKQTQRHDKIDRFGVDGDLCTSLGADAVDVGQRVVITCAAGAAPFPTAPDRMTRRRPGSRHGNTAPCCGAAARAGTAP